MDAKLTMALSATRGPVQAGVDGNWTEYMRAFGGKLYRPDVAPTDVEDAPDVPAPAPNSPGESGAPTLGKMKITNPLFETATGN
jgi:hypothetical protein